MRFTSVQGQNIAFSGSQIIYKYSFGLQKQTLRGETPTEKAEI